VRDVVRERRTCGGRSQADPARALGASRQTAIAIEQGRYRPSLPLAFALARHFGTEIEALFHPDEEDLP
jgi:putative transcriptional regulator